jgi:hypothetical protein
LGFCDGVWKLGPFLFSNGLHRKSKLFISRLVRRRFLPSSRDIT